MRRRAPGETVERIRRTDLLRRLDPLRRRTVRWVANHLPALQAADPAVPEELDDRQADTGACAPEHKGRVRDAGRHWLPLSFNPPTAQYAKIGAASSCLETASALMCRPP